ncbi:UDP-N-acetylhexosamine pyrophosphorylase [Leptopilina boulardi]|uniref:UDP-N-acetylhexosamine pyrophosphorylase n=1 Tax=Leptopilina boulardi TaxID=63433 RepID=UPI0021F5C833|nr:UDP-N-acetylhexosamine pyrophosphorylase [Leptopilina boulardi]
MEVNCLKEKLEKFNQVHLLRFWDKISDQEKSTLFKDILELDLPEVTSYFAKSLISIKANRENLDSKIKPIPENVFESVCSSTKEKLEQYELTGLKEISEGRVAILLLAGGQGTRLGVNYPKGMYDVGLPSHSTLFRLQALRIRKLQELAEEKFKKHGHITWYIMTSEATHETTLLYFEKNDYFGLKKENIKAFKQEMLPCFTFDGKIILDEKCHISKAPDGNGGLYRALKIQGVLDNMKKRGINSVHVFSVDNILVKIADPIFLGFCLSRSADCGVKVVPKRSPNEAVGVVCQVEGQYRVVEYSEITSKTAELRNNDGELVFNAGNICNHYFTLDFLCAVGNEHEGELDLHVAKKKIPYINENGIKIIPNSPNGIKVEKFVFDVFKFAKNFAVWETIRECEFSALKNPDVAGFDCPSTVRKDLMSLQKKWLINAGAISVNGDVEISPLLSYAGENLEKMAKGKHIHGPVVLSSHL